MKAVARFMFIVTGFICACAIAGFCLGMFITGCRVAAHLTLPK